jgi:hypothetical protein
VLKKRKDILIRFDLTFFFSPFPQSLFENESRVFYFFLFLGLSVASREIQPNQKSFFRQQVAVAVEMVKGI